MGGCCQATAIVGISSSAIVTELLVEIRRLGSRLHGVHVDGLRLPEGATPGLLARRDHRRGSLPTPVAHRRRLLVSTQPARRHDTGRRILAVHRSGRLAHWFGDTGS